MLMSLGNATMISQWPAKESISYKAHEKEDQGVQVADVGCHLSATATT